MASSEITFATGFVRLIWSWDYEVDGHRYKGFVVNIEKIQPRGEMYRAFVDNPLFQSLLTTAFANGIIVDVASHSTSTMKMDSKQPGELVRAMASGGPVIDVVIMPPMFPQ